jgi:cell division protein FtsL
MSGKSPFAKCEIPGNPEDAGGGSGMRKLLSLLVLSSIPALMLFQMLQAYRYMTVREDMIASETRQEDLLEKNRRLQAGIAVFDAPARIFRVAEETLGLESADSEDIIHVRFPESAEESR